MFLRLIGLEVERKLIDGTQSYESDFVALINFMLDFDLKIVVCWQKGQFQRTKQKLQIGPSSRSQERCTLADRPLQCGPDIRCTHHESSSQPVIAAITLFELKNRAQCIASVGRKSTTIKVDLANKIDIQQPYRPTACPLGGEVIDIGNFYIIEIEAIFVGCPTADDKIVAE